MRRMEHVRSVNSYSLNYKDSLFENRFPKKICRAKKKPVMRVTGFLFPLLETMRKMKSEKVR